MESPYRRHHFPPEIISHAVRLYHRFTLSFRDVEDVLAEPGITASYEAIRSWCRRRVVHFNVTTNPTAFWTAQQMIEAFPEDTAPRYLLRDRDEIYGNYFRNRVAGMGIKEVLTAPRSPWRNLFVEPLMGSIRRECLGHVIVLNRKHPRRILNSYFGYYHRSRIHLGLEKDAAVERDV